mgnify:CR=1 FL=1
MTTPQWHTVDKNLNGEIWKRVVGNPNFSVSNKGRVLSHSKVSRRKSHGGKTAGFAEVQLLLKPIPTSHGYLRVAVTHSKKRFVHDLVTRAFLGLRPEGYQVNHINGKKTDNRLENLLYMQSPDYVAPEPAAVDNKYRGGSVKLNVQVVRQIKTRLAAGQSGVSLARDFHVSQSNISAIKSGKSWTDVTI